jgi:hypothetical protein
MARALVPPAAAVRSAAPADHRPPLRISSRRRSVRARTG